MLRFAIKHRVALDTITAERAMNLRNYELGREEWKVAEELCKVLKVSSRHFSKYPVTVLIEVDLQGRNTFLLSRPLSQSPRHKHRDGYPCYGHHR